MRTLRLMQLQTVQAAAQPLGNRGRAMPAPVIQQQPVAQLAFADAPTATQEGLRFRTVSGEEFQLNTEINELLDAFQESPSQQAHQTLMPLLEQKRQAIQGKHVILAAIIDEYEASAGPEQTAFFTSYLADKPPQYGGGAYAEGDGDLNHVQIQTLFDNLRAKTVSDQGLNNGQNDSPERSRFLLFMLQGMHDDMGVDQYRKLNNNLGHNRQVIIDQGPRNNLLGGVASNQDVPNTRKTDDGQQGQDANLLANAGSALGFLNQKFAAPYPRTANPNAGLIGDVQVIMDRDDDALPIFTGVDQHDQLKLFSAPKKMTVHHEIGHLNSMLQGMSGAGHNRRLIGDLSTLSEQEEMYNIWGGPRSDRAYGESLGFPRRIDHQTLIPYRGDALGSTHDDFTQALKTGYGFTNTLPQLQALIIDEIRRLADSYWGKVTQWKFVPSGVDQIRTLLNNQGVTLQAIQQRAQQEGQRVDADRHGFTQFFYNEVGGINVGDRTSLKTALVRLKQVNVPQAWGDGQFAL
jgi:hypothetical protein